MIAHSFPREPRTPGKENGLAAEQLLCGFNIFGAIIT